MRGREGKAMNASSSMAASLCCAILACGGLLPASAGPTQAVVQADGQFDFPAAVERALRQSPLLKQGTIQLEVRRLDERDGKASYWPTVHLGAVYMIDAPESVSDPYSLRFSTGDYNPVGAYFTTQARREIVRLAELTYLQAIADGLRQAGELFLTLAALEEAKAIQAEQLDWAGRYVAWWSNRLDRPGAPLELQAAEHERAAIRLEGDKLSIRRRQAQRNLSRLLGFDADDPLPEIQTAIAREQVLEGYAEGVPDRERAEDRALELRMLEIHWRLQKLGVKGAYAEYLPRPTFTLRSTDPLDETQEQGLYFSAGISVPIWDAGWRRRNVLRQKALLEQREMEQADGLENWRRQWAEACDQRKLADAEAALAAERLHVAELNFTRQKIAVDAGREEWPALRIAQQGVAEARLQAAEKALAADLAALAMRHFSREFLDRYVAATGLLDEGAKDELGADSGSPEK